MAIGEMIDRGEFYSLNPRFLKMDEKVRGLLIEIADTPSREKDQAEALLERVSKIISACRDPCLKELLEIEMDGAATAHVLGKPNNYYNSS